MHIAQNIKFSGCATIIRKLPTVQALHKVIKN